VGAEQCQANDPLNPVLSRFKLKFSPDKVDTMVIQAIALLDDLDKEINIYSMRVKVPLVPLSVPSQG
jgi:RNA processing factor Prp31